MIDAKPAPARCPEIRRSDIELMCRATDDFSPLHLDQEFSRAAGHPDVVVPGTMLLGWVGDYLVTWAGGFENLRRWQIRFVAPIWPGESVTLEGVIVGKTSDGCIETCAGEVVATGSDGRVVGKATAEFTIRKGGAAS
jgi:acyl dehydratase